MHDDDQKLEILMTKGGKQDADDERSNDKKEGTEGWNEKTGVTATAFVSWPLSTGSSLSPLHIFRQLTICHLTCFLFLVTCHITLVTQHAQVKRPNKLYIVFIFDQSSIQSFKNCNSRQDHTSSVLHGVARKLWVQRQNRLERENNLDSDLGLRLYSNWLHRFHFKLGQPTLPLGNIVVRGWGNLGGADDLDSSVIVEDFQSNIFHLIHTIGFHGNSFRKV